MKKIQFYSSNFNELLFENRNKNYGAYIIRTEYEDRLTKSFFIAMLSVVLLVGIFVFSSRKISETIVPKMATPHEQLEIEIDLTQLQKIQKQKMEIEKPLKTNQAEQAKVETEPIVKDIVPITEDKMKPKDIPTTSDPNVSDKNVTDNYTLASTLGKTESEGSTLGTADAAPMPAIGLDVTPEFPGGEEKMMAFLAHHVNYPIVAKENGIKGTVYVSFVIDKLGKVKDIKIKRGLYSLCDEEVLRVINLFPDWKVGMYQGKPVSVIFNLPVKFELRN